MTVAADQRYTASRPCPVCGGYEGLPRGHGRRCHGYLGADGRFARCSREERAGVLPLEQGSETYAHRLAGECRCGMRHDRPPIGNGAAVASVPRRIVAEYPYRDECGVLLFVVERHEPKRFLQKRPVGGGWIYHLGDVRRVLYRLPELLQADPTAPVFIVEGEKAADRLAALGLVVTTNPGGAGKWRPKYGEWLRGRHVVILPDDDEPGRRHGEQVAHALHGVAASVKVVSL